MGKVYEALTRAGKESRTAIAESADDQSANFAPDDNGHDFAAIDFDDSEAGFESPIEPEVLQGDEGESIEEAFNFLRYSLGGSSAFRHDHKKRQQSATAVARRSLAQPAREVTIQPGQIDPHLVAFYSADPRAAEHYNKLALSLISKAAERGIKRVLVASPQKGDGRTTVTLNLACALARARQRVLVVDCDLMEPSVARMLGIDCETGMVEAFTRQMAPGAAAIRVLPYGFNVLPTRRGTNNPVEILAAPGFWKMLQTFDTENDFILFDSPPLLAMGDSSLLVRFTDATMMVIRAGATNSTEMAKAITPFTQEDILGVVINRARS
jgi:Mrp family chromosome partitioning ATPase